MCQPVNDAAVGPACRGRAAWPCAATISSPPGCSCWAATGGPALTVRAACREAALTERYFYESFSDREDFVRAVYDDVCARAMTTLTSATTPREAVERFVELMVDDPVRGRVLLLAPTVEPVLTRSGAEWMPNFIDLLQRKLSRIGDPALQKMIATSLVGGLSSLFTAYLNGTLDATRKQFIDYCVDDAVRHGGALRSLGRVGQDRITGFRRRAPRQAVLPTAPQTNDSIPNRVLPRGDGT